MLTILHVIVSLVVIALVLIQERSTGLSGVFGGSGATAYQTRRGIEKIVFVSTGVAVIAFVALALLNLIF